MMTTKIEWCHDTWNPITGCTKKSDGCKNCYAIQLAKRLSGRHGYPKYDPFKVTLHPDKLSRPSTWKKPRMVFVGSMGDLFHEDVEDDWLKMVFNSMEAVRLNGHKFLLLTKRPENILSNPNTMDLFNRYLPMNFIWLGITAENQKSADERIPQLLQIPAAIHFVSIEPLLEQITIPWRFLMEPTNGIDSPMAMKEDYDPKIDWIIVGGESGHRARPMHPDWVRSIRDQCNRTDTAFFFKQRGTYSWQGGNPIKMGKKHTGRLLDGRTWDSFPF